MRGAPQSKFSMLIRRISVRSSTSICGRPSPRARFPAPIAAKAGPMPTHHRFRLDNRHDLQDRGKPAIHLNEEPAIVVRKVGSASHLPLQNDQLMSKYRILSLKPALRLEWRGQHGQNEADQRYHCANLADSVT